MNSYRADTSRFNYPPSRTPQTMSYEMEINLFSENKDQLPQDTYLTGWRSHLTIVGLFSCIFLATMEVSIVSTALVDIVNELHAFGDSTWVINAYILTFTGFLIIWAQFSHSLGKKPAIILALLIFIAFSGACAGAQTSNQLIIFRALQGIGGAGVFNMSMVILAEATRPEAYPKYTAMVSILYLLAFGLGPIIGGGIASSTTWRWVFWLNIPACALPLMLLTIALPNNFARFTINGLGKTSRLGSMQAVDIIGGALFLGFSILFVTALQGANSTWQWSSPTVVCLLVFGGVCLVAFTAWERFVTLWRANIIPVLTWKFTDPRPMGLLMSFFLVGTPTTAAVIQIPTRFQTLYGETPFNAGLKLLPFILSLSIFAALSAVVVGKRNIKHTYVLFMGTSLQIIGVALLSQLSESTTPSPAQYGYQVILAAGLGINNSILTISVPHMVDKQLVSSALAAGMQFRYLGGAVGVAVTTVVFNSNFRSILATVLDPVEVSRLLQTTDVMEQYPDLVQQSVRHALADSFNLQWKALLGFICAEVPAALLMW